MPRKRNEPSLIDIALASRWPFAAAVSAFCAVVGFVVVPGMLASNATFRHVGELLRTLSLFPVCGFGLIAVVKYLRESTANKPVTRPRERWSPADPARPRPSSPYSGASADPVGPPRHEPFIRPAPTEWSLALLQSIEWKRFEEVIAAYFRAKNFRCETIAYGPDGGVDGRLYFGELPAPVGIVQCKAWGNRQVGVAPVRELRGVMAHEKVDRGYFCATGDFSQEAITFAASNPIKLITGRDLLEAIAQMPEPAQHDLLAVCTTGDYTTPTCASCGIKLVERTIGGKTAWGCRNFPRCRTKIFRKSEQSRAPLDRLQRDQATLPARQRRSRDRRGRSRSLPDGDRPSLPSAELAIARVAEQVGQGGHHVPSAVVRRRFTAGRQNFERLYRDAVDDWTLYDNAGDLPKPLDWKRT